MELKKRKGLFYTADALLAVSILFIFMLLAVPMMKVQTQSSDLQYDIISALSSTQIGDLVLEDASAQTTLNTMIANGRINDSSKSSLEALGLLYIQDRASGQWLAEKMFESIDSEYNFGIWVGSNLIYNKSDSSYLPSNLTYIDSARQIVSGVQEGKNITGFAARAYLAKTMNTKYYYFGGYVGDGNISIRTDYEGNISSAEIEVAISTNFDLYVNNNYVGNYNGSTSNYYPVRYILPTGNFASGENTIEFRNATNQSSIAGGFVKINYKSDIDLEQSNRYYFPGVKGVINIYDGFYLPGNVNSMNLRLNFSSPQNISLFIGNVSVYQGNSSGSSVVTRDSNYLDDYINYSQLSERNIPIRIGMDAAILVNSTRLGNADIIVVVDVSGSMNEEIGGGNDATDRDCNDPDIYDPDTSRISLAKCLVSNFTYNILAGVGNNVSLIRYGSYAELERGLISNFTLINSSIFNDLDTIGGTCISCGLNLAYDVLRTSNSSRSRYIFVMTDGQANDRGAQVCNMNSMANYNELVVQAGLSNRGLRYNNGFWDLLISGSFSIDSYGLDFYNLTYGFKVGEDGNVYNWSGTTWTTSYDINGGGGSGGNDLYAVSVYSPTLAFAVGQNGFLHNWTGSNWRSGQDIGATLRGVDIYDSTFAVAVGDDGNVYNWSGTRWSNVDINGAGSNLDLNAVTIYNSSFTFTVGENGYIYRRSGVGWDAGTDVNGAGSNLDLFALDMFNASIAFAVGENGYIYRWDGVSWTQNYLGSYTLRSVSIVNSTLAYAAGDPSALLAVWNGTNWSRIFVDYMFNETGISCGSDDTSCGGSFSTNGAAALANISAYRAYNFSNATVHSVGFSLEDCYIGNLTVVEMARSGGGTYFVSSDPSALNDFFNNLSQNLYNLSFKEQKSSLSGNLFSILHPDSYIEFNFDEPALPTGLRFSIEKKFTNESNEFFDLFSGDSIIDARVNSYSGAKWTDKVYLNNSLIYNITYYGNNFTILGDPFNIYLPKDRLNLPGRNRVNLTLYPSGITGSLNNSIVYTVVRNITAYSNIGPIASGCNWHIKTQSNGIINLTVPSTYSGSSNCYYLNKTAGQYIDYDDGTYQDVYILAAYSLLEQLDSDGNGEIDINLEKDFFEIDTSTVSGIPFEWRTEVSVRVWE